jgi:hypothetical protein
MASDKGPLQKALEKLKRLFRKRPEPEAPGDPYSYVTAPKPPRPSIRGAAAVADIEE